jgi:protein-disulfide isomerase
MNELESAKLLKQKENPVKGRHLAAVAIALVVVGVILFFGLGGKHEQSSRTAGEDSTNIPAKVEAASVPAAATTFAPTTTTTPAPAASPSPSRAASQPTPAQASGVPDVDPRRAYGSKSAPITMEVFSDFQCPACKQLYKSTNQLLLDNYVNTNKVYLIHRDFPLPMHAYSRIAARYVRAASQLGKSEQAEKALFDNQEKWEQSGDVDGTLAAALSSADMTKIRAVAKGTSLDAVIEKDVTLGKGYNVNQTPTTIIHYKGQTYPVVGVVNYDVLHSFLDQLLSQR